MNPKLIGATVIGLALVLGAYTLSSFTVTPVELQTAAVAQSPTVQRTPLAVVDNDGNGIEDWRDEFVTTDPIIIKEGGEDYEMPETLTGRLGINFFENIIRAKGFGPFSASEDEVIQETIQVLSEETAIELYDTPDITIMTEWNEEDIVNYANTAANVIYRNSVDLEGELFILHDIITAGKTERIEELRILAEVYKNYRDEGLLIPVPAPLVKEHLDVINSMHAIHKDIEAMTLALNDPAFTMLRLKRYEDDATGLVLALQNLYLGIKPYASYFEPDDPAIAFVVLDPSFRSN